MSVRRIAHYPLTKLQEIMFLHSLSNPNAGLYITQICISLYEAVDTKLLQTAWNLVIERHDMLRAALDSENATAINIYNHAHCAINYIDLTNEALNSQHKKIEDYLKQDRVAGFAVKIAPLIRLQLFKLSNHNYELIWTHHHAVLAGGSVTLVLHEVFSLYDALIKGGTCQLPPVTPYKEYVNYFSNIDFSLAENYWRNLLVNFANPTQLAVAQGKRTYEKLQERVYIKINKADVLRMQDFAKQQNVTMNTLIQAAWGLLLAKYSGEEEVVFGSVRALPQNIVKNMAGLFINTLPMRLRLDHKLTVSEYLQQVRKQQQDLRDYMATPLTIIQQCSQIAKGTPLFDTCVDYKPNSIQETLRQLNNAWQQRKCRFFLDTNLALTLEAYGDDGELSYRLVYAPDIYSSDLIKQIAIHVKKLTLELLDNAEKNITDVSCFEGDELKKITSDWNSTKADYPKDKTVIQLFESQVLMHPNALSVIDNETKLTFASLNANANRLAHYLHQHGVKANDLIGICLERSVAMVITLLAVAKAGAAYVPIDPAYPDNRIKHMLINSNTQLLITQASLQEHLQIISASACRLIDINEVLQQKLPCENLPTLSTADDLAYVIYTSGSTGNPKGVMIKQRSLVNLIVWHQREYKVNQHTKASHIENISFDAASWSLWAYLTGGGCLYIADETLRTAPNRLYLWLAEQGITHCFLPTALAEILLKEKWPMSTSLKYVLTGGDVLHKINFPKSLKLINHYGPTEATVVTTASPCIKNMTPNIGKPIANTQVYILDRHLQVVPVGVTGEIYIGGDGLATGYFNMKKMTNEKFISNPFSRDINSHLYKTGDLARWLPDGNIDFVGRTDDQVKVRGFRIEISEVENYLLQHPDIEQCVVAVRMRSDNAKYLTAYVVFKEKTEVTTAEMRKFLLARLPEYMLPSIFINLSTIGVNKNGKIDRNSLPDPMQSSISHVENDNYASNTEKKLLKIWSDVLRINSITVKDNFFELGGDSIIGFQIAVRAHQVGLSINSQKLFSYPTIEQLAQVVDSSSGYQQLLLEQGLITGDVNLTPIQRWFFEKNLKHPGHFNQTCLLKITSKVNLVLLKKAFVALLHQHDALRMQFTHDKATGGWHEVDVDDRLEHEFNLTFIDLSNYSSVKQVDFIKLNSHVNFKLDHGPLIKAIYFKLGAGNHDRLLILIHHLVIDGVSWRILLEDLHLAYQQLLEKHKIHLPVKTTSFKHWSEVLAQYARHAVVRHEIGYWAKQIKNINEKQIIEQLHIDYPENIKNLQINNRAKFYKKVNIHFSKAETDDLLQRVHGAYNTKINDLLLSALLLAFDWNDIGKFVLHLEQEEHGREHVVANSDLSHTIGWFTTVKPLQLMTENVGDLALTIESIKQQLLEIPDRGIGYGVLKYLSADKRIHYRLTKPNKPKLGFNYLGRLDDVIDEHPFFSIDKEGISLDCDKEFLHDHIIDVDGFVLNGSLQFTWSYSEKLHKFSTIKHLAHRFKEKLLAIVEHCKSVPNKMDTYPLSATQSGFLFHKLYSPESDSYFIQHQFMLEGNIDKENFKYAWQKVVDKYEILRAGFIYHTAGGPQQYILKTMALPWRELDWSMQSTEMQKLKIQEYIAADRQVGFNLIKPPLIRANLIKLAPEKYLFLMSYHHILLDGWSWAIVVNSAFVNYENLSKHQLAELPYVKSYRNYIDWLAQQDYAQAQVYWRDLLHGFVKSNELSIMQAPNGEAAYKSHNYTLSATLLQSLEALAKENQLTLSTIIQGAWALLLSCYSNEKDVVYGNTIADRPVELDGVEKMVGLMINTLPVRVKIEHEQAILQFLKNLQEQGSSSRKFGYAGLLNIQNWSDIKAGDELFTALFLFENYPKPKENFTAVKIIADEISERIHYKIICKVICKKAIELCFEYDSRYFDAIDINAMLQCLVNLLVEFSSPPMKKVNDITWLSAFERKKIMQWGHLGVTTTAVKTIVQQFEKQVAAKPNKTALIFSDEKVSYQALNIRVNQLANYLHMQGVLPGDVIGISLIRSINLVVCLLAVLKLGASYVPLDPHLPSARLEYMLQNSNPKLILTTESNSKSLPVNERNCLVFISEIAFSAIDIVEHHAPNNINDLAYILYTSGSTGQPKGVVINQAALANFFAAISNIIPMTDKDVVLALTPYTFDIFGLELYMPLLQGAEVVLAEQETILDAQKIIELLEQHRVTIMQATPVTWRLLLNNGWHNSQGITVLSGGEALNRTIAADLLQCSQSVWNLYGPTEATIWATVLQLTHDDLYYSVMPIGKPLANTEVYVLDQALRPLPVGAIGELYIGGKSLAQGYLGRADLTQERFIPHPFSEEKNAKIYKTGDLVKWLPNGNLYYVVRNDNQVKVHGFRIELAEIEACLLKHPAVKQGTVLVVGEDIIAKHLVAYIVPQSRENPPTVNELREFLKQQLPDYMLPTTYVMLDAMPLTTTQKIDKNALRELQGNVLVSENKYTAPHNLQEKKLLHIWCEVLKITGKKISTNDNFFDLGGDSISAIWLLAKIQQEFSTRLTMRALFAAPTITQLSEYINEHHCLLLTSDSIDANNLPSPVITLQQQGNGCPLFLIHPIGGTVYLYMPLVKALGTHRPVYAIQDPGIEAQATLFNSFTAMASYYVRAIKETQSLGPYLIAGASFGANMAVEVARQLQAQGDRVAYIGLIDGWAIYPAKANNDRQWFEENLGRQHKQMQRFLPPEFKLPQTLLELNWHRQQLLANYQPPLSAYELILYKSAILVPVLKAIEATYNHWDDYTTLPIKLYHTPGDHESMLMEPNVGVLAMQINESLKNLSC